jgi:hypothetical protein
MEQVLTEYERENAKEARRIEDLGVVLEELYSAAYGASDREKRLSCAATHPAGLLVYCGNCHNMVGSEHLHCNICNHSHYDLCSDCITLAVYCFGTGHSMTKRCIGEGRVVDSNTEERD